MELEPPGLSYLHHVAAVEPAPGVKFDIFDSGLGQAQLRRMRERVRRYQEDHRSPRSLEQFPLRLHHNLRRRSNLRTLEV